MTDRIGATLEYAEEGRLSSLALKPTLKRPGLFDEEEESIFLKKNEKKIKELRTRRRKGILV